MGDQKADKKTPSKRLREYPKGKGKGGRKKDEENERKFVKTVRFNKSELDKVLKNVALVNEDFSVFVRKLALNPRITLKQQNPELVNKVHGQILRIGHNINQMARALNTQYGQHDFTTIQKNLEKISIELSNIFEEIKK